MRFEKRSNNYVSAAWERENRERKNDSVVYYAPHRRRRRRQKQLIRAESNCAVVTWFVSWEHLGFQRKAIFQRASKNGNCAMRFRRFGCVRSVEDWYVLLPVVICYAYGPIQIFTIYTVNFYAIPSNTLHSRKRDYCWHFRWRYGQFCRAMPMQIMIEDEWCNKCCFRYSFEEFIFSSDLLWRAFVV